MSGVGDTGQNEAGKEEQGAPTFSADNFGGKLQGFDVLRTDVLQSYGQLLGLAIEKLNRHGAGQLLFGHRLRRVGRPVYGRGGSGSVKCEISTKELRHPILLSLRV